MNKTKILLLATVLGAVSCSTNNSPAVLTSGIKSDFLDDSTKTKDKYIGKEIEVTGYFDYDEDKKDWEFNILDSNIHNQEDDSTDENTLVSKFADKIHGMRLGINTDLDNNAIASQNIVSPIKMSGGYWIYDKSQDKFYSPEKWGNIADVIQILSKDGGTYYNEDVVLDSGTNLHGTRDLKINDTTVEMLDNHLRGWVKDISSLQNNNIMYSPIRKYQKIKVIDIVTLKGKVNEITRRTGNYEVIGTIDVLVVNLKDTKIVKKQRVDISDFVVLDYTAKRKMVLAGHANAVNDTAKTVQ